MNSSHAFIIESIRDQPIGETAHFVWFITDIGIAALFKGNENFKIYSLNVEKYFKGSFRGTGLTIKLHLEDFSKRFIAII